MAIDPLYYNATQPLDFRPLMALGQQLTARRESRRAEEQKIAQQQQMSDDIEALGGNLNPESLLAFSLKYPQLAEAAKGGWDAYSQERKDQNVKDLFGVASSLQAGNLDAGLKLLGERKSALVATGEQVAETEAVETLLQQARDARERGDEATYDRLTKQAMGIVGAGLGFSLGEKANPLLKALGLGGEEGGKVVGYGDAIVDPVSGEVIYQAPDAPFTLSEGQTRFDSPGGSSGRASGPPAPRSSGAPLTVRLNNPGAIKDGSFARGIPGYSGSENGFAKFVSPAAGAAAQRRLLKDNYLSKGFNTPRSIIERYAPRGPENSDASVNNYIAHISRRLGVGSDERIPESALPALANAIADFERGSSSAKGGDQSAGAVASVPKAKEAAKPSSTRSLNGKVYVKIDGRWFQQGAQ